MSDNEIKWVEPLGIVSGSTSYGHYDNEIIFQTDAIKVGKYCARKLGYPIVELEISSASLYNDFESAIDKYAEIINEFNITNNFSSIQGIDNTIDLTNKLIEHRNSQLVNISNNYGNMIGVMGDIQIHSTSINIITNQQKYDLKEIISNDLHSGSKVLIHRIYHFNVPTEQYSWNNSFYSLDGDTVLLNGYAHMVMPVSYLLTHRHMNKVFNSVISKDYSFELNNNVLKLYPIPDVNNTLEIEYILEEDLYSNSLQTGKVSSMNNAGYNTLQYSDINQPGKNWIKEMTLALFKQTLGIIRSKYSSIPIPDGDLQLDGDTLRNEGKAEEEKLIESLENKLELLRKETIAEKNLNIARNTNEELETYPGDIIIG